MHTHLNKQFTLKSRPHGEPTLENFEVKSVEIPQLKENEVLLRTIYLSLDPYMRGRMNDAKSYADPVEIGDVMVGATVCQVEQSNNDKFAIGEWVLAYTGWQEFAVSNGEGLMQPNNSGAFSLAGLG